MFRNTLAVLAVLGLALSSQAGVIVTSNAGTPSVNLPGFTLYTLTAASDNGANIVGFDFASQAAFGFFGSMNQVNPAAQPTVFQDNNAFFAFVPGSDVSQDSQFKYLKTTMTVPAGFESESNTQLRALFASGAPGGLGTSTAFVQLAIPNAGSGTVQYLGQIQTQLGTANPVDNTVQGIVPNIPEPASIALVGLALLGLVGYRRR